MKKITATGLSVLSVFNFAYAENSEELQDMSDPLAGYTQVGTGFTYRGLNLKVGQTFDTGNAQTMGMNVFELKGFAGDVAGWDDEANDSVDSIRFRRFGADLTNGRGSQIDASYDFGSESRTVSYSIIQTLPKWGPVQLFPLAGAGAAFCNNIEADDGHVNSGYSMPGTFAVVGTYGKVEITDNIWSNYNLMCMSTLSGSDRFKEHGMAGESNVFAHEFAASYQFTPRFNIRYFASWTEYDDFRCSKLNGNKVRLKQLSP
jgi:hypothetical protein